jgi:hypothetical protein
MYRKSPPKLSATNKKLNHSGPLGRGRFTKVAQLASMSQQLRVLQPVQTNDWLQMLNATMKDLADKHTNTYCSSLRIEAAVEAPAGH